MYTYWNILHFLIYRSAIQGQEFSLSNFHYIIRQSFQDWQLIKIKPWATSNKGSVNNKAEDLIGLSDGAALRLGFN